MCPATDSYLPFFPGAPGSRKLCWLGFHFYILFLFFNFRKILEKYLWRSSFYSKVTGISPAAVLKSNSFTSIFQGFCGNYDLSFFFCLLFRSTYFKKHLLLSGCFWKYCFKHINGKENKKDSCVFHKHMLLRIGKIGNFYLKI